MRTIPPSSTQLSMQLSTQPSTQLSAHFTLYSRSYCHLCQVMLDALNALCGAGSLQIDVIDIDLDEDLLAKYDALVPVLFGDLAQAELCHYFLDHDKVMAYLTQTGSLEEMIY